MRVHWIAILALVVAHLPSSLLAGLASSHQDCGMACCIPVAALQDEPPAAAMACHPATPEAEGASPCPAAAPSPSSEYTELPPDCSCEFSAPANDVSLEFGLASQAPNQVQPVDADDSRPALFGDAGTGHPRQPGILGSDSGPPAWKPAYAWLGRAPPVFLA